MLSIVARDTHEWLAANICFQRVSLNVSAADFYIGDLLQKISAAFGKADVPLDLLMLEVSEDSSMGRGDKVISRQIERLRRSGLQVALDDFGTGQASLTHLVNLPVDEIKIDRSFIARLEHGASSSVIVQGLIDIARQLNIRIVAEGIVSEAQASQLWTMGCTLGQGFAFSAAVESTALVDLLRGPALNAIAATPIEKRTSVDTGPTAIEEASVRLTGTI